MPIPTSSPGQVVKNFRVRLAPVPAGGGLPAEGDWLDYSRQLFEASVKINGKPVEDTRSGASLEETIVGIPEVSVNLGIRTNLTDADNLIFFFEDNFSKRVWLEYFPVKPGAPTNGQVGRRFQVLVLAPPKIGGKHGDHSAQDTVEYKGQTWPDGTRDGGTTWASMAGG